MSDKVTSKLQWAFYIFLLISQFIFVYIFDEFVYYEPIEKPSQKALMIITGVGAVMMIVSYLFHRKACKSESIAAQYSLNVTAWGIGESVALLGITGYFLDIVDKPYNYYFFGASIILHLINYPKKS